MMIRCVYWDTLSTTADQPPVDATRHLHVFWPSPIDADACFQEAGFDEFADSDDEWDSDWRGLVDAAIDDLQRFGPPAIREPIAPVAQNRLLDRLLRGVPKFNEVALSLTDQVVLTTMDDRFPHAIIDFGGDGVVTLVAGDGHPLLWILSDIQLEFCPETMASHMGKGRPCCRRELDWAILGPPKVSVPLRGRSS